MYKPHHIVFHQKVDPKAQFDERGRPIAATRTVSEKIECFLDNSKPQETIYTIDGQVTNQVGGIIYLDIDCFINHKIDVQRCDKITVTDKNTGSLVYEGRIKGFKHDMFHDRIFI